MTLLDFRLRWRVGLRLSCRMSIRWLPVVDVLSGVSLAMRSLCRYTRSANASALHFGVSSHVQTACPERAMPAT